MAFRLSIAATRSDWINLFGEAKGDTSLQFYAMAAPTLENITPMRLDNLPGLGIAKYGVLVQEDRYLALPVAEPTVPREIRQNNGVVRYVLDQLTNLDSFVFIPGGIWTNECYLIGEISSLHTASLSVKIAKKIRSVVRRTFHSSGTYWIGPECKQLYSHCKFTADCRF